MRLHSVPPDFRAMSMGFRFTLRQLRYFLAAAEAPTITAAAKKANVSQGAMAEALDELERQLGSPLFVRRKARGVFITAYGEALVEHARTVLTAAEELQSFAAGRGGFGGHATIGSYTTLAPFLLPRLADALAREHPDLHLDIVTGSGEAISRSLREGRCDIAILYSHHLAAGMDVDTLYSIGARIVLPAAHPLARRKTIFLGDLAQERLIEFDVEPALSNTRKIFHDFGVRPRLGMKADSIELIRALVARGLGYSVLLHHPPGDLSYEGIALAVRPIRGLTSLRAWCSPRRRQFANRHDTDCCGNSASRPCDTRPRFVPPNRISMCRKMAPPTAGKCATAATVGRALPKRLSCKHIYLTS